MAHIKRFLENSEEEKKSSHYMFFNNLLSIKRFINEIEKLDKNKIEELLENGHDWAADHIATSKDNIEQVSDFLINNK